MRLSSLHSTKFSDRLRHRRTLVYIHGCSEREIMIPGWYRAVSENEVFGLTRPQMTEFERSVRKARMAAGARWCTDFPHVSAHRMVFAILTEEGHPEQATLAHEVSEWKPTLPPRLRGRRVLLLLDGHGSRRTAKAIRYLNAFGIDVLTFPGHSTHVLQPFDVGIAGVFEAELLKLMQKSGEYLSARIEPATTVGLNE